MCVFCLFANVLVSTRVSMRVRVCVCVNALFTTKREFSCHRVNKTILFSLTKRLNIINSHIFAYIKIMLNRRNRDKICNVCMYVCICALLASIQACDAKFYFCLTLQCVLELHNLLLPCGAYYCLARITLIQSSKSHTKRILYVLYINRGVVVSSIVVCLFA